MNKVYGAGGYLELADMLYSLLFEKTGIAVSIGIANSKVLCKIAADKAKHGNSRYFIPFDSIEEEISDYCIDRIWGVGRNTVSFLKSQGIYTAGDILKRDKAFFEHFMGKRGLELKFGLEGEYVMPIRVEDSKPKSIQKTSSFFKSTNDKDFLKKSILEHLHNACRKMRKYRLCATEITVMLRTKDFRILTAGDIVEAPTNAEYLLNRKVISLFNQIYSPNILCRSAGVYVGGFRDEEAKQLLLFNDTSKFEQISRIWDKIEERYGRGIFSVGDCRNLII